MNRRTPLRRRGRPAFTIIEALVASLILTLSVAALVSMWRFSFHMTTEADTVGMSYVIGRRAMEKVKLTGFDYTPNGTTTLYYDSTGGSESQTPQGNSQIKVTVTVGDAPTSTAAWPAYAALRLVTVNVVWIPSGQALYQTQTYLVKQGV